MLLSDDAIAYFRLYVLQAAHEIYHSGDPEAATLTPTSAAAKADFIEARFNPAAVAQQFELAEADSYVPTALIQLAIENLDPDGKKPTGPQIAAAVRGAFGDWPTAKVKKIDGKATRVWFGLMVSEVT